MLVAGAASVWLKPNRRAGRASRGELEELLGVAACTGVGGVRTEHPAQLADDVGGLEQLDGRRRDITVRRLLDPEVAGGERRDLRPVRDADDLSRRAETPQPLAHRACRLPADPPVDLRQDERAPPRGTPGPGP